MRPPVPESHDGSRHVRLQDDLLERMLGKKVMVSTTDFHYICGRFVELRGDGTLRILVGDREVQLRRRAVARIQEADGAIAQYIK